MYYVSAFKNNALFNFIKEKTSAMCAPYCFPTFAIEHDLCRFMASY